jgi:hypothetical protein
MKKIPADWLSSRAMSARNTLRAEKTRRQKAFQTALRWASIW